jgi:cytochrome c6
MPLDFGLWDTYICDSSGLAAFGNPPKGLLMKRLVLIVVALFTSTLALAADLAQDATYKTKCAMCHGANGEGKAAMKTTPLKDSSSKSESELVAIIAKGKPPKMPAYEGKIKPEEIKTLVGLIKGL